MTKAQKAKLMKELADKVAVRNHIQSLINGPRGVITVRETLEKMRQFVVDTDKELVDSVASLVSDVKPAVPAKKDKALSEARKVMAKESKKVTKAPSDKKSSGARRGTSVSRVLDS